MTLTDRDQDGSVILPPVRGQFAMVAGSQVLASTGNFAAALAAARVSSASEFGSIALVLAFYVVAVQLVRPFAGNVVQIAAARGDPRATALAQGVLPIAALLSLLATSIFTPIVWVTASGTDRHLLVVTLALIPLLVVHDTLRIWAISNQRAQHAVALDAAWLVALLLGLTLLIERGAQSGAAVLAVWASCGAAVACAGWLATRHGPPADFARARAAAARIGPVYLVDAVLSAASLTGFVLFLPLVASIEDIGRLRVLEMPFGVLAMLAQGLTLFVQPTTRRSVMSGDAERAWRLAFAAGAALGMFGVTIGASILLFEDGLEAIFGSAFKADPGLVVALTVKYSSLGVVLISSTMARSLGARRETLAFGATFTVLAVMAGLGAATVSVALGYGALYLGLAIGSCFIVSRIRHRPYTAHTV